MLIHATTVSLNGKAVLLCGPSGSGKSSLALALMDQPGLGLGGVLLEGQLVADDQTTLTVEDGILIASPPPTLAGLLEVRGQGIIKRPHLTACPVVLVVDLLPVGQIERMPTKDQQTMELLGIPVARVAIDPAFQTAAARIRVAWNRATGKLATLS